MILLDASALISLLAREPAESAVRSILREGGAAMVSVNLAEVIDVLARRYGIGPERSRAVIEPLLEETIAVLEPKAAVAWRAGALRSQRCARASRPLSLADCFLVASAGSEDAIATLDAEVRRLAEAEGVRTVSLEGG